MIYFTIPGEPVPKGRPRVTKQGIAYTPKKTREYEALVKESFLSQVDQEPMEGPVRFAAAFYFKIPKSYTEAQVKEIESGEMLKTTKPDLDNCIKSITDALNGLAYKDDSQIVRIIAAKKFSATGDPHVEVGIYDF